MPLDRLPPNRRSKIAAKGNATLREQGRVHKFTPEQARAAVAKRWENKRLREQKEELERQERENANLS